MSPRTRVALRNFIFLTACFTLATSARAFPTWIGVTGNVQRQTGGNPGTFSVMMNQNYATLHAAVGISVNGSGWKEYPMAFEKMSGKNSIWTFTPAALFPSAATVRFYFRGWDDAGGSIADGTTATGYSFVATAIPVFTAPGDVDLFGSTTTMGSLLDDLNRPVFYLSASDNGTSSEVRFRASRSAHEWFWERAASMSNPALGMRLDSHNNLTLFDSAIPGREVIVLDPNSPQPAILINGERVLTATSIAGSYLPRNPIQLSVGINNTVGTDALAVGSSVQATGQNATALGSNTIASGDNSVAVGDHLQAQGFGQFVTGTYNVPQGNPAAVADTDQLFAVGNGTDNAHRANAVTILRNGKVGIGTSVPAAKLDVRGDTNIGGELTVSGAIRISPQGDLSMGEFTQGTPP